MMRSLYARQKENVKCSSKCQLCCPHQDTTDMGKARSPQTTSNTTQPSQKQLGPWVGSVELCSLGWACWASSASVAGLFVTWRSKAKHRTQIAEDNEELFLKHVLNGCLLAHLWAKQSKTRWLPCIQPLHLSLLEDRINCSTLGTNIILMEPTD